MIHLVFLIVGLFFIFRASRVSRLTIDHVPGADPAKFSEWKKLELKYLWILASAGFGVMLAYVLVREAMVRFLGAPDPLPFGTMVTCVFLQTVVFLAAAFYAYTCVRRDSRKIAAKANLPQAVFSGNLFGAPGSRTCPNCKHLFIRIQPEGKAQQAATSGDSECPKCHHVWK